MQPLGAAIAMPDERTESPIREHCQQTGRLRPALPSPSPSLDNGTVNHAIGITYVRWLVGSHVLGRSGLGARACTTCRGVAWMTLFHVR